MLSQFPAWLYVLEIVEIKVTALFKKYRKFPTMSFLSFSLEEFVMPRLLFLVCREMLSCRFVSESLVPLISLLKLDDLRSKVNWMGLTAQLLASSVLSSSKGDSRLASLIFLIP